jgi:hypothetical protein
MTLTLAGAPALLTSREAPEVAARRGTVLVYHGFGGDKAKIAPRMSRRGSSGGFRACLRSRLRV